MGLMGRWMVDEAGCDLAALGPVHSSPSGCSVPRVLRLHSTTEAGTFQHRARLLISATHSGQYVGPLGLFSLSTKFLTVTQCCPPAR